jgi:hypothetical protein
VLPVLFSALSERLTVPVSAPLAVGANATPISHCPPALRPVLDVQSIPPDGSEAKFAEIARFETCNAWLPASVTVTTCVALVESTFVVGKFNCAACVRFT